MTDLSPAAQAVLDAYYTEADRLDREVSHEEMLAAALHTVAYALAYGHVTGSGVIDEDDLRCVANELKKTMTNLSPAAQAVLDAYGSETGDIDCVWHPSELKGLAAVLRAAADQVISPVSPPCEDFDEYAQGFLAAHIQYRDEFLAIADELEKHA